MQISLIDAAFHIPAHHKSVSELGSTLDLEVQQQSVYERVFGFKQLPVQPGSWCEHLQYPITALMERHPNLTEQTLYILYPHTSEACSVGVPILEELVRTLGFTAAKCISTHMFKCVGSIACLTWVARLLVNLPAHARVMLVLGELAFTPMLQEVPDMALIGEVSGALLLGREEVSGRYLCMGHDVMFDGRFAKGLWLDQASKLLQKSVFASSFKSLCERVLYQADMTWSDIKQISPHNINRPVWQRMAECFGIPMDKVLIESIGHCGHALGVDVFLNLWQYATESVVMMCSVGMGTSYGCAIWVRQ